MIKPMHVCIFTTAHALDDMRVNEKIGKVLMHEGIRVSWAGPRISLCGRFDMTTGFFLHLFSMHKGRIGRLLCPYQLKRIANNLQKVDVFYCPDPDSALIAIKIARKHGARVIFDIHENYYRPKAIKHWGRGPHMQILAKLIYLRMQQICRQCDLVMGVSDFVVSPFRKNGINPLVIRSCAPLWFARESYLSTRERVHPHFTIMHGKGAKGRATATVLKALSLAAIKFRDLRLLVFDVFTEQVDGYGPKAFFRQARDLGIHDLVELRHPVPLSDMPVVLRECDIGLIAYGRDLGVGSLPNRLFEFMAAGLPVVAPVYAHEIARIVHAEGCGLLVDFEDCHAVADAIVYLRKHPEKCLQMGARARKAFMNRHNWEVEVKPLLDRLRIWGERSETVYPNRRLS